MSQGPMLRNVEWKEGVKGGKTGRNEEQNTEYKALILRLHARTKTHSLLSRTSGDGVFRSKFKRRSNSNPVACINLQDSFLSSCGVESIPRKPRDRNGTKQKFKKHEISAAFSLSCVIIATSSRFLDTKNVPYHSATSCVNGLPEAPISAILFNDHCVFYNEGDITASIGSSQEDSSRRAIHSLLFTSPGHSCGKPSSRLMQTAASHRSNTLQVVC